MYLCASNVFRLFCPKNKIKSLNNLLQDHKAPELCDHNSPHVQSNSQCVIESPCWLGSPCRCGYLGAIFLQHGFRTSNVLGTQVKLLCLLEGRKGQRLPRRLIGVLKHTG